MTKLSLQLHRHKYSSLSGFLSLPEEGDPDPVGQHDHGVEAAAQRPDDPERVLRDPQ